MLCYNRIVLTEETELLKAIIVKHARFVTILIAFFRFKFQNFVFIGCHDFTILCPSGKNVAIITVKSVDYHCVIMTSNLKQLFC